MAKLSTTFPRSLRHNSWRIGTIAAVSLVVAGCSAGVGGSDFTSLYQIGKAAFGPSSSVSLEEASSVPYASIGVRVGDSSQIMLILASDNGGTQLWTSSSRIALETRQGRIIRTAGLGNELADVQGLRTSSPSNNEHMIQWAADYPALQLYSLSIVCEEHAAGEETIRILGKELHTDRIEEKCRSSSERLDWSFKNVFWKDPDDGFVWKSVQTINPNLDSIEIEVLRPPT